MEILQTERIINFLTSRLLILLFFLSGISSVKSQSTPRFLLPIGHTQSIESAGFSSKGSFFYTASDDHTARIYDAASGKEIHCVNDEFPILHAFFSPDEHLFATVSQSGIRLWYTSSGLPLHKLENSSFPQMVGAFSPDGARIIGAVRDTLRIWDAKTGQLTFSLADHNRVILSMCFSPEGKTCATTSADSTARIWDVRSGKLLQILKGHTHVVSAVCYSPDGKLIATASSDSTARIFDVESGKELRVLRGHQGCVGTVCFSPNGEKILTASKDLTPRNSKTSIFKVGGGYYIEENITDSSAFLFEVSTGRVLSVLRGHKGEVTSASFSPDGKLILTSSFDNTVRIWDSEKGVEKSRFEKHGSGVNSACFDPSGKFVLSIGLFWDVFLFEVKTGKLYTNLLNNAYHPGYVLFSPNGRYALHTSGLIWDVRSGKPILINDSYDPYGISTPILPASSIFHPTKNQAILQFTYEAKVYDFDQKSFIRSFKLYSGLSSAVFSPDGNSILVVTGADSVQLLDYQTGNRIWSIFSTEQILKATFSPNGKWVVTSGLKGYLRVYEVSTGILLWQYKIFNGSISSAVFSQVTSSDPEGGRYIIASCNDGILRKINTFTGELIQEYKHTGNGYIHGYWDPEITVNGNYLLTRGNARFIDLETGKGSSFSMLDPIIFNSFSVHSSNSNQRNESSLVLATTNDNRTILWDSINKKMLYTRLQLENNEWLVYDEHYRFDGTPGAIEKLYFVCGTEVIELNQLKDSLFVPNLVQRIMNRENLDHIPAFEDLQMCNVTPLVEPIDYDGLEKRFRITPRNGGVGTIDVYFNGVLRYQTDAKHLKKEKGGYLLTLNTELQQRYSISGEELSIKVVAKTKDNSIGSRGVKITLETQDNVPTRKPSVHAIMIGIDDYVGEELDLNFAAKDANDLQMVLESAMKKYFNLDDTNRVHFYNLTIGRENTSNNLIPDKGNVFSILEKIKDESKPEDIFLLFFAGHGEIVDQDQLLLLTAESGLSKFEGIRMKELLDKMSIIPAGKRVLILDACHSGAAINNLGMQQLTGSRDIKDAELQSQRMKELDQLSAKSGFALITASSSDQKALELPEYEHGLLTYALLNALLNNPISTDENGVVQLEKWLMCTEQEVSDLNREQSAERLVPVNFSFGKIDQEVRQKISLSEIPSLFLDNVVNIELGYDELELRNLWENHLENFSKESVENRIIQAKQKQRFGFVLNLLYTTNKEGINIQVTLLYQNEVVMRFDEKSSLSELNSLMTNLMNKVMKKVKSK